MYRHILIPTDGSELSDTAVRQGVQLARSLNARVTVFTVTVTFHTFTAGPFMASRTAETYRVDATTEAERALSVGAAAATAAGVPCETVRVERDHPYEAIIDAAAERGGRPDLHGIARPQGHGRAGAGQRDHQGAHAQQDPRPGLPVSQPGGDRGPRARRLIAG